MINFIRAICPDPQTLIAAILILVSGLITFGFILVQTVIHLTERPFRANDIHIRRVK